MLSRQKHHKTVLKLWKRHDLGPLYTVCHCKDQVLTLTALFSCVKFSMASNLTTVYHIDLYLPISSLETNSCISIFQGSKKKGGEAEGTGAEIKRKTWKTQRGGKKWRACGRVRWTNNPFSIFNPWVLGHSLHSSPHIWLNLSVGCREEMDTSTESQEGHAEQNAEDEEEQPAKSKKGISRSIASVYFHTFLVLWSIYLHAVWKGKNC